MATQHNLPSWAYCKWSRLYDLRNQDNANHPDVKLSSDPKVVYFKSTLLRHIIDTLAQLPKPEMGRVVFHFVCKPELDQFKELNLVLCGKDTSDRLVTSLYLGSLQQTPNATISDTELRTAQGYFIARNKALSADPRFRNEYQGYAHEPATIRALLQNGQDYIAVHLVFDGERTNLVLSADLLDTPAQCSEVPDDAQTLVNQALIEFGTMCCPPK